MARIVIFCMFLGGLTLVMNLSHFNDIEVNNSKFSFKMEEAKHKHHVKELEDLALLHAEAVAPKKITDEEIKVKTVIPLDTPSLVRADKLYKQCISCHGKMGAGKKANKAPRVGGQLDWYISKQLTDMKSGIRINKTMKSIVKKLSIEDISDLSNYISKLPWVK